MRNKNIAEFEFVSAVYTHNRWRIVCHIGKFCKLSCTSLTFSASFVRKNDEEGSSDLRLWDVDHLLVHNFRRIHFQHLVRRSLLDLHSPWLKLIVKIFIFFFLRRAFWLWT
jgi:hypothetical protein